MLLEENPKKCEEKIMQDLCAKTCKVGKCKKTRKKISDLEHLEF